MTKMISIIPLKEPKSSENVVAMIHGLMDMAANYEIDHLAIQYRIGGEIYSYSLGKK